jgi:hypothetical protein
MAEGNENRVKNDFVDRRASGNLTERELGQGYGDPSFSPSISDLGSMFLNDLQGIVSGGPQIGNSNIAPTGISNVPIPPPNPVNRQDLPLNLTGDAESFNEWFARNYSPEIDGQTLDFNGRPILMKLAKYPGDKQATDADALANTANTAITEPAPQPLPPATDADAIATGQVPAITNPALPAASTPISPEEVLNTNPVNPNNPQTVQLPTAESTAGVMPPYDPAASVPPPTSAAEGDLSTAPTVTPTSDDIGGALTPSAGEALIAEQQASRENSSAPKIIEMLASIFTNGEPIGFPVEGPFPVNNTTPTDDQIVASPSTAGNPVPNGRSLLEYLQQLMPSRPISNQQGLRPEDNIQLEQNKNDLQRQIQAVIQQYGQ